MPFALLLQTTTKPIIDAADLLAPWERLAFLEMQILERARSVFLVRWFGNATPITGLSVSIGIANLDELRARVSMVVSANNALAGQTAGGVTGAGLLEPLSGLAGGLAGAMFSPTNSMALAAVAARVKQATLWTIVAALNWLSYGLLGTAAGLLVALPYGVWELATASGAQIRLLAALGPLLINVRRFWDQLTGPRERVAHPLVRAALRAGDALAGLVPFLLAGIAIAVTRIGPELESLAVQFILLTELSWTMVDLFQFIWTDAHGRLTDALTGRRGIGAAIHGVFDALSSAFSHTGGWLGETWANLVALLVADKAVVDAALSSWWLTARPQIRALTVDSPMIGAVKSFAEQLGIVADVWKHSARPSTPASGSPGPLSLVLSMLSRPGPPFPTAPTIPAFPVTSGPGAGIASAAGALLTVDELLPGAIPNPIALDDASWAALEAARRPGGVFAGRAAALRRSITPGERTRREQAQRDLDAYMSIAERLASPALAQQLSRLDGILAQLHGAVGRQRATAHPVRELDDRPVLLPQIRRLRIQVAPGGDRAAAEAWTRLLRERLVASPVTPAAGS